MSVYYNEIDPYPAQWLRNLIAAGHLPEGDVDERSIADVQPSDLAGYRQCHFFAGIGGWPLALRWAGAEHIDGLWTGSCPCQPFSVAGKQKGTDDTRHLWPVWFRLIESVRPDRVYGEQVDGAITWLDGVYDDLEGAGYAVGSNDVPACSVGAPHRRNRIWFVAHTERHQQSRAKSRNGTNRRVERFIKPVSWDRHWQDALREFRVLDDGLSYGVGGVDAARNAIVPQVAAEFIRATL